MPFWSPNNKCCSLKQDKKLTSFFIALVTPFKRTYCDRNRGSINNRNWPWKQPLNTQTSIGQAGTTRLTIFFNKANILIWSDPNHLSMELDQKTPCDHLVGGTGNLSALCQPSLKINETVNLAQRNTHGDRHYWSWPCCTWPLIAHSMLPMQSQDLRLVTEYPEKAQLRQLRIIKVILFLRLC